MAIKTSTQSTIPELKIDRIQFSDVQITVSQSPPYKIGFKAEIHPYGVRQDGSHLYTDCRSIDIPDVVAFIMTHEGSELATAMGAMVKVQEGLGMLSGLYFDDLTFESYVAG